MAHVEAPDVEREAPLGGHVLDGEIPKLRDRRVLRLGGNPAGERVGGVMADGHMGRVNETGGEQIGPNVQGECMSDLTDGTSGAEPEARRHRQLFTPLDPADFSSDLGQQIRALRQSKGLTLEAIAQRSGISIGALSQVERGKGNPAFFTLIKIAHALEVPLTNLLSLETRASPVVRVDQRRPLAPHFFDAEGVQAELLTPDLDRQLQVVRYLLPVGASTEPTPFSHHGEEFLTVLAGALVVGLDGVEHELGRGDSIAFSAMAPHWFANPGPGDAEVLFACTPPTF